MDIKGLLPIGSVVLLNNGTKRLMIFGVKQTDSNTNIEYDYIGVLYPEGNMGEAGQFLFNNEDINHIDFTGFEDEERTKFINNLEQFYAHSNL